MDLAFLGLPYHVEKAHFSISISGSNDENWVTHGFADEILDEEEDEDEDDDTDQDETPGSGNFNMDPMAPTGEVDTNMHRKDPREYFLTVYDVRIRLARAKWCDLVDCLEDHLVCSSHFHYI
jgi:hypothetical protein